MIQRRRQLMTMQSGELPSEYRRVEYLQTPSGGTYIDSGVVMSAELVFEIDFQLPEATNGKYFMGEYAGTSFYLYISSGSSGGLFQTAFGANWSNTSLNADTNRHKFIYAFSNGNLIVKNDDAVILEKPINQMSARGIIVAGTKQSGIPVKTFSSKMFVNGIVIQNFVPCVRKSDSKPGMYDTVSKTFYTNAGTGEFIVPN